MLRSWNQIKSGAIFLVCSSHLKSSQKTYLNTYHDTKNSFTNMTTLLAVSFDFNFTVTTFCAFPLWNINLTWYPKYDQPPDFTPCNHKTILVYVPALLFYVLSQIEFSRSNVSNRANPIPWAWLNIIQLITKFLLCVSTIFEED